MKMTFGWVISLAAWLLVSPRVGAQGSPLAPEHGLLKQLEGKWEAVVKTNGQESKGEASYKLDFGGLWLTSEFTSDFGGVKFQGHGIDGYDPDKKKYVSVWVDSMTAAPMLSEGTYDAAKKTLTMHADSKGPDGKTTKIRSVTVLKDKDRHTFEMYSKEAGGEEQLMLTIEYTRKK